MGKTIALISLTEEITNKFGVMSERTLRRRFQKLIDVCGGNYTLLQNKNGKVYFDENETSFVKHILTELVKNEGILSKFIDKKNTNEFVGIEEVRGFIQSYIGKLEEDGYNENEIKAAVEFLSMLFLLPVHVSRENCYQYVMSIWLNLQAYPYTHQVSTMKQTEALLKKQLAVSAVNSIFMIGELSELIQSSKNITEDGIGIQDYGNDTPTAEYFERDRKALQLIQSNPEIRAYVERLTGQKAEEVFNVAASTMQYEKGGKNHGAKTDGV